VRYLGNEREADSSLEADKLRNGDAEKDRRGKHAGVLVPLRGPRVPYPARQANIWRKAKV